jgi:hypothetical protein
MGLLRTLLAPFKRRRAKLLAEKYRATARTYGEMADVSKSMCPEPRPLPWFEYCKIQEAIYEMRAEEMESLI